MGSLSEVNLYLTFPFGWDGFTRPLNNPCPAACGNLIQDQGLGPIIMYADFNVAQIFGNLINRYFTEVDLGRFNADVGICGF